MTTRQRDGYATIDGVEMPMEAAGLVEWVNCDVADDLRRLRALPGLRDVVGETWSKAAFGDWVAGHGEAAVVTAPVGRRLKGDPPASVELLVKKLVAALHPLADAYPMPHYRRPG